jgi:hypothetical protein
VSFFLLLLTVSNFFWFDFVFNFIEIIFVLLFVSSLPYWVPVRAERIYYYCFFSSKLLSLSWSCGSPRVPICRFSFLLDLKNVIKHFFSVQYVLI